jgi:hypothetical protein
MVAIHSRRKTSKKAGATCTRERMLHTRPPLDRMQQIFSIIKSGESPNRHQLAAEIEVTVKTIQRDIDFMRDRLRLPISFDQSLGGYTFTEPVSSLAHNLSGSASGIQARRFRRKKAGGLNWPCGSRRSRKLNPGF